MFKFSFLKNKEVFLRFEKLLPVKFRRINKNLRLPVYFNGNSVLC